MDLDNSEMPNKKAKEAEATSPVMFFDDHDDDPLHDQPETISQVMEILEKGATEGT